jgi:hypothetical protein
VGFAFQSYALFNHMTVRDNIAFGLKIRKTPRAEIDRRVDELLLLVQLRVGVAVFEVCGNPGAEMKPRAPGSRLERFAKGLGRLPGFAGFEQPESVSLEQRGDRIDLRRGVIRLGAGQRIGTARAALVHKDQVPLIVEAPQELHCIGRIIRGRATRAPRQQEDGIGGRIRAAGLDHGHIQVYLAPASSGAVFEHGQRPTLGLKISERAGLEVNCGCPGREPAAASQQQDQQGSQAQVGQTMMLDHGEFPPRI